VLGFYNIFSQGENMPKRPRLSAKEIQRIQALIAEGKGDAEIASAVKRSRASVYKIRHGTPRRNTTSGGKHINVRLTDEEYAAFKDAMKARDLSLSEGGRRLVRMAIGALDLHPEEVAAVHAARKELNSVGVNLNQLTSLAQSGKLKWNARDGKLVQSLDARVFNLVCQLQRIVSAARVKSIIAPVMDLEAANDG
jgi:hypothetical protein